MPVRTRLSTHRSRLRPGPPLAALLLFSGFATGDISDDLNRVEWFFANRHLDATFLDSACALLAATRPDAPTDTRGLALWCQVNLEIGDDANLTSVKLHHYRRTLAAAESLKTLDESNPAGHFWWAAAYGDIGLTEGMFQTLNSVPAVKRELERTLQLDSDYVFAYALLGIIYQQLPVIAGGNPGEARRYFEGGLARAPNFTLIRLELARLDLQQGDTAVARQGLNELLATEAPLYSMSPRSSLATSLKP